MDGSIDRNIPSLPSWLAAGVCMARSGGISRRCRPELGVFVTECQQQQLDLHCVRACLLSMARQIDGDCKYFVLLYDGGP